MGRKAKDRLENAPEGQRWCASGHLAPITGFGMDRARADGLRTVCRACRCVGGPGTLSEKRAAAGRKGGLATAQNPEGQSKAGKKGGNATVERHGREHMADIGRKGGEAIASDPERLRALSQAGQEGLRRKRERQWKEWPEHARQVNSVNATRCDPQDV